MAKLESEGLSLQINKVIQWDDNDFEGIYESFDINIMIRGEKAIRGVNGTYELCCNIEMLIEEMTDVLNGNATYKGVEFTEPDFRFEIKKVKDWVNPITKEIVSDDYVFICWVNSGQWNGIYSDTEIGCKFRIKEKDLVNFRDQLQLEYDNRRCLPYK